MISIQDGLKAEMWSLYFFNADINLKCLSFLAIFSKAFSRFEAL